VDLHNFQGFVQKSATVHTNDPQQPQFSIHMKAMVTPFIQVRPSNTVLFRGFPEQLKRQSIDVVATGAPFHILKLDTTLPQQIAVEQETVEDGKHYRLHVSNTAPKGTYNGFILCRTDHPKRPEIRIIVTGAIEGDLNVSPLALFVGLTGADQPLRTGEIRVRHNRKQAFQITRLTYDDKLISVTQESKPEEAIYTLKVTPRMENVPKGEHRETTIAIETDARGGTSDQVRVNVVNH
jgi:hypothetical protein